MARKIELVLEGRDAGATAVLDNVQDRIDATNRDLKLMAAAAVSAFGALTAGAAASVKAAMDAEQPWSGLRQQLHNIGVDFAAMRPEIEAATDQLEQLTGIAGEDMLVALRELVGITQDYRGALADLPTVLDLAAAKDLDLVSAATLLGRAQTGNTEILSRYGIVVSDVNKVSEELRRHFGGIAAAEGASLSGRLNTLTGNFGKLLEEFGFAIIEGADLEQVFSDLGRELLEASQWIRDNSDEIEAWAGTVKDVTVEVLGAARAAGSWAVEHRELLGELAKVGAIVAVTKLTLDLANAMNTARNSMLALTAIQGLNAWGSLVVHIKSARDVTTMLGWAFGGLTKFIGPVGILVTGVGAVALLMREHAKATREARADTESFTKALADLDIQATRTFIRRSGVRLQELQQELAEARRQAQTEAPTLSIGDVTQVQGMSAVDPNARGSDATRARIQALTTDVKDLQDQLDAATAQLGKLLSAGADAPRTGGGGRGLPALTPFEQADLEVFKRHLDFQSEMEKQAKDLAELRKTRQPLGFTVRDVRPLLGGSTFALSQDELNEAIEMFRIIQLEEAGLIQSTEEFAMQMHNILNTGALGSIAGFGEGVANALQGVDGAFDGLLMSVTSTIGDMMIAGGTQIVLMSQAFQAFKSALTSLIPAKGIAAGVALIAAGAFFKQGVSNFLSSPTGGGGGLSNATPAEFGAAQRSLRSDSAPVTLVLEGDVLDWSSPEREDRLAAALERLSGREVRVIRRKRV